jgi:hypothetical protein
MANTELPFPIQGINEITAAAKQPQLTSPDMNNVRPQGVLENRIRGGQRPGQDKRYAQRIGDNANYPVIALLAVTRVTQ